MTGTPEPSRTRRSRGHFAVNVLGSLVPVATALATVPLYLSAIGTARYGIVSVAWILLGYFGFLDFGLSRASANALARVNTGTRAERAPILVTALTLNLAAGLVGSVLLYACARLFLAHGIRAPGEIMAELRPVLPWLAAMLPLGMVAGVATGALESRELFVASNALTTFGTIAGQLFPLLAVYVAGPSLGVIIPALFAARVLTILASFALVIRIEGRLSPLDFDRSWVRRLLNYGAWVTVTSLISPLLESLDQFLIAALLGVSAVAEYAVPMNLAMRSQIVALALARTLFPQLSRLAPEEAATVMEEATLGLAYGFGLIVVPAILLSHFFLRLWVGAHIAAISAPVAAILLLGAWANGVAFIPYAFLQGKGRPDLTAKAHMVEIIPFVLILVGLTHLFGLPGAALAWTLRVAADLGILLWMSGRPVARLVPAILIVTAASITALVSSALVVMGAAILLFGTALAVLGLALSPALRTHLRAATGRLAHRTAPTSPPEPLAPVGTPAAPLPAVSVALATYNGAAFLAEQLASLVRQTHLPAELVVSDDNSSDATRAIVEAFASTAPFPVRLLPPGPRLGYADNFLRAARACTSPCVAFCDQDDVWLDHKLATCVARLVAEDSLCATHRHILTDAAGHAQGELAHRVEADGVHEALTLPLYANPFGNSMVFRRELLDAVAIEFRPPQPGRPELPLGHDTWVYNIAASLGRMSHIAEPLVLYRQHGSNVFGGDWTPPDLLHRVAARLHVPLVTYREQARYHRMLADGLAATARHPDSPYAAASSRAAAAHARAARILEARLMLYEAPVARARWQASRDLRRLQSAPSSKLVQAKETLLGLCGLNPLMRRMLAPVAPSERI